MVKSEFQIIKGLKLCPNIKLEIENIIKLACPCKKYLTGFKKFGVKYFFTISVSFLLACVD